MIEIIIALVIGAFVGANLGLLVAALCNAAGKDQRMRDEENYHDLEY